MENSVWKIIWRVSTEGCQTKTIGTNAIFIMTHKEIKAYKGKYTYTCVCLDHRPQREDPYHIWITAGGNLIK